MNDERQQLESRLAELQGYCRNQLHHTGPGERPWSVEVDQELATIKARLEALTPTDPQPQSPEQIAPTPVCDANGFTVWTKEFGNVDVLNLDDARSLERRAVKAEYALTAANAATSAMREERDRLDTELQSIQRRIREAVGSDAIEDCAPSECVALIISQRDNAHNDRDSWQRRAQENEAGMAALEVKLAEEQANYLSVANADALIKEAQRKQIADLSAAAEKHEAEVATAQERLGYLVSLAKAPNWQRDWPMLWRLNIALNVSNHDGKEPNFIEAIDAARHTASEPQQP